MFTLDMLGRIYEDRTGEEYIEEEKKTREKELLNPQQTILDFKENNPLFVEKVSSKLLKEFPRELQTIQNKDLALAAISMCFRSLKELNNLLTKHRLSTSLYNLPDLSEIVEILPDEVFIHKIFIFLPLRDLYNLSEANKELNSLVTLFITEFEYPLYIKTSDRAGETFLRHKITSLILCSKNNNRGPVLVEKTGRFNSYTQSERSVLEAQSKKICTCCKHITLT
jgi:hypothetical protein